MRDESTAETINKSSKIQQNHPMIQQVRKINLQQTHPLISAVKSGLS
jgi:hypothetical protein